MKRIASIACMALVSQLLLPHPFLRASSAMLPSSFTAGFRHVDAEETSSGRYFAGPEGIRMEDHDEEDPQVVIVNFSRRLTWILRTRKEECLELDFHPGYAGALLTPCPDPQAARRIGEESLGGRMVEKWICEDEATSTVWFDPSLQIAIRTEGEGHRFELDGIEERELPGDLFEPPPGYEVETLVPLPPPNMIPDPRARWRWLPWQDEVRSPRRGLTSEQIDEVVENLETITDILRGHRVLVEGAEILPRRSIEGMVDSGDGNKVASYELRLSIHRPRYRDGQPSDSNATLSFRINSPWVLPPVGFSTWEYPIHLATNTVGEVAGVPIHHLSRERARIQETAWVLSSGGRSPWLPVSREGWIRTLIGDAQEKLSKFEQEATEGAKERRARFERSYEGMKRISPEGAEQLREQFEARELGYSQVVDALQAHDHEGLERLGRRDLAMLGRTIRKLEEELEEMPPKLRSSQAYCCEASPVMYFAPPRHATRPSLMVEPDDKKARALLTPNPDFLRSDLPATAMQSITVRTRIGSRKQEEWEAYLQALRRDVDWQALMRLLE